MHFWEDTSQTKALWMGEKDLIHVGNIRHLVLLVAIPVSTYAKFEHQLRRDETGLGRQHLSQLSSDCRSSSQNSNGDTALGNKLNSHIQKTDQQFELFNQQFRAINDSLEVTDTFLRIEPGNAPSAATGTPPASSPSEILDSGNPTSTVQGINTPISCVSTVPVFQDPSKPRTCDNIELFGLGSLGPMMTFVNGNDTNTISHSTGYVPATVTTSNPIPGGNIMVTSVPNVTPINNCLFGL